MTIEMASRKMTVQTRHLTFWCFLRYLCPLAPHFPHNRQQQKQQPPHVMRKASRRPRATITSTGIIRAANWRGCGTQEPCLQPCALSYMDELGRERARDRGRGRKRGKPFVNFVVWLYYSMMRLQEGRLCQHPHKMVLLSLIVHTARSRE